MTKERVIAYIDGFNLYFGMKHGGRKDTLWLNIQQLAQNILRPYQELVFTKYFTSMVSNDKPKELRQRTYVDAICTLGNCKVYYGNFMANAKVCKRCGLIHSHSSEKMTDVNIAVEMISDAHADRYDTALLISGDSDLVPPINAIHELFPQKKVFVAFPPNRKSLSIKTAAKGNMEIGMKKLLESQFPENVQRRDGFMLSRPATWH